MTRIPTSLAPAWIALFLALGALASSPGRALAEAPADRKSLDPPVARTRPGSLRPLDRPDIVGDGKITRAGNLWVKTTNIGYIGNPFTALSSDPAAQWPGPSGVEYLFYAGLWVGAKDPATTDPSRARRVSQNTEWRPASLDPVDHIYEGYAGMPGSLSYVDDDHDGRVDEDPLDGRDNDQDGEIDEDFAAPSEQIYSCVLRDDTPEAIQEGTADPHLPLGLQVRQTTYAFSAPEVRDVVYFRYEIQNVSGHTLDSVFVGLIVDQDVGPVVSGRYFADDLAEPRVPQGPDPSVPGDFEDPFNVNHPYYEAVKSDDPKAQLFRDDFGNLVPLCPFDTIHVNGFTVLDGDGDDGQTPAASIFLLLDHTVDGLGLTAPRRVGFRMYSYYVPGTPFSQGGLPGNDAERFRALSSTDNIDPATGLITAPPAERVDDYSSLCSVGPFLDFEPAQKIQLVWALVVQPIDYSFSGDDWRKRYRKLVDGSITAVMNYRGRNTIVPGLQAPSGPGRESGLLAKPGQSYEFQDCRDKTAKPLPIFRVVNPNFPTWFDLDCNFCTGVEGHVLKPWLATGPPPNPRVRAEPEDHKVKLLWDNFSEYTPDAATGSFDFAGYRVWRAASWKRPVGSVGPTDDLWELLATYNYYSDVEPLIELVVDPMSGDTSIVRTKNIFVNRAWRPGSPYPRTLTATDMACLSKVEGGDTLCDVTVASRWAHNRLGGDSLAIPYVVTKYPVGRYEIEDPNVLNGFLYLYSVTAFDSSGRGASLSSFEGRRAARESEGVIPQSAWRADDNGGRPFVVPNPYRARASWDLAPNARDPTGTHVDFFNLPPDWVRIRIYTLSGDLVEEIRPTDLRVDGKPQRESADDSQATWNLVSRNGQDVMSGIYLFSVEATDRPVLQGKFVIIR